MLVVSPQTTGLPFARHSAGAIEVRMPGTEVGGRFVGGPYVRGPVVWRPYVVVAAHRSGRPLCSTSDQAADRRPFGSEASLRSLKIAVANRNPPAAGRGRERTSWDLFRVGRR